MGWDAQTASMKHPNVVLGAGIAGLLLAGRLQAAGEDVVVLEKSRGLGGRLATKRVGEGTFDQGAQYMTAREPEFAALIETWTAAGVVTRWPGNPHRRHLGTPVMTALPKKLAEGLDVRREHPVKALRRMREGGWQIELDGRESWVADRVFCTAPVPQTLALLEAGSTELPAALRAELGALTYHPCLALLFGLDGPSAVPNDGVAREAGPVRWVADNAKKSGDLSGPGRVTVHASPEFSAAHYTATVEEVAAKLRPEVEALLGAAVMTTTLHRWKFSQPVKTYRERCVWLPEWGLGLAGDAFGGPKVEGAALSGLALASAVTAGRGLEKGEGVGVGLA